MHSQFPADIQNCINQIKNIDNSSLPLPDSKRMKIEGDDTPVEIQKMILLLNTFKQNEMILYIKSLKGTDQCNQVSFQML